MRVAVDITLSEERKQKLEKSIRSRSVSIRLSERSKIILLAAAGMKNKAIAQKLGIPSNKVGLWRNRFSDGGIQALSKDIPRGSNHGGNSSLQQARLRNKIIKKATQETPINATHWSTRTLAEELNSTRSFVNRVLNSVGLNPPEHAIVFCVDEKTSIQALDRTQPGLPLKKGRCNTMTHDYKRNGTTTPFAALDVATGEIKGECHQKHTHKEFLSFLKKWKKIRRGIKSCTLSWITTRRISMRRLETG
jgi:transposase